jgi:hypothetical protein
MTIKIINVVLLFDFTSCMYSTHKHSKEKQRLRFGKLYGLQRAYVRKNLIET